MGNDEVNWGQYLTDFHNDRAGTIEAVLSRAVSGDHNPYRWLARAVGDGVGARPSDGRPALMLDLACGSGAMARELAAPGRTVIGLDRSAAELRLAATRGSGVLIRGDGLQLPLQNNSVDAVTSSIGLVVITPLSAVLAEIARVLRPGGVLAAMAPALRPLSPADARRLVRISGRLRTKPQFPGPVEVTGFAKALQACGLRRVEDQRERFEFMVSSRADAELVMSALYLPQTRGSRVAAAIEYLEDQVARQGPVPVAIPMRRLVAIK